MPSSIFLHFINRELHNSVGLDIKPNQVHRAIRICTVASELQLLCNISQLYEALFGNEVLLNEIKELSYTSIFLAESSAPTLEEFREQRRALYYHDQTRYPMYFSPTPSSVDNISMEPFPEIGMTQFLENTLSQFNPVSDLHPARSVITQNDLQGLAPLQGMIQNAVRKRESRGVTFALFANELEEKVRPIAIQMPLRRLLSGLYIYHYCERHDATRMTGYPGISTFDIKSDFPLYDFHILDWILQCLGYWDFEAEDRYRRLTERVAAFYSQEHSQFVEMLQYVLSRARASVETEDCSIPSLRHRIQSLLAKAVANGFYRVAKPETIYDFYRVSTERLIWLDRELESAFDIYREQISIRAGRRLSMGRVLIFTATDIEDQVVYEHLSRMTGLRPPPRFEGNFAYFYYGSVAGTELLHVRSHAGSTGGSGAIAQAQEAIPKLSPDVCLSVGICFGLSQEKLDLGDVVVGQRVHAYEPGKESEEGFLSRGSTTPISPVVFDRIRSTVLVSESNFRTHYGLFLSGEKLSNSPRFVNTLRERHPEALAGDMEAHGLAEISQRHNVDFAVIKGVADWGQGKTDDYQRQAALNAMSVVRHSVELGAFANLHK